jgi:hypothetical protein
MARFKNVRSRTVYRFDPASSHATDALDNDTTQPPTQLHPLVSGRDDVPQSAAASLQMTQSSSPLTASQQKQQSSQSLHSRAAAGDVDARL